MKIYEGIPFIHFDVVIFAFTCFIPTKPGDLYESRSSSLRIIFSYIPT